MGQSLYDSSASGFLKGNAAPMGYADDEDDEQDIEYNAEEIEALKRFNRVLSGSKKSEVSRLVCLLSLVCITLRRFSLTGCKGKGNPTVPQHPYA